MKKVLKYPTDALRVVCSEVTEFDTNLHQLVVEMCQIMVNAKGMGLAANQIGVTQRIFVMKDLKGNFHEFINPEIVSVSDEKVLLNEGCLSAPGVYVQLPRCETVRMKYKDKDGEERLAVFNGIEAVCVQHETDHLNGVFYIDKLNRQQKRAALRSIK